MAPHDVARVLSEIAEVASETLELGDVIGRVATALEEVLPLDNMGIVRVLPGDKAELHASTVPEGAGSRKLAGELPLSAWSPRLRPRPGPIEVLRDSLRELDPSFGVDAEIVDAGVRSALWEPFHVRHVFVGGVWASSRRPRAFTEDHRLVLRPVAAILGSAVEHWRIWRAELKRGDRFDRLERVLGEVLAESLDIRDVFEELSSALRPVIAHDALALSELEGERGFRLVALAADPDVPAPRGTVRLSEAEAARKFLEFEIVRDVLDELQGDTERNRIVQEAGMRSWLRVPVRLWGEVSGSLAFLHREPDRFREADVEVARRVADRVALALSHYRLAEEAQAAERERERAERLTATVETLTRELGERHETRVSGVSDAWHAVLRQVARVAASDTTVLITGESGTGKEVVSRLIHQGSGRVDAPFVALNCAALPDDLLESELFGHEKGAFTGAIATKVGHLEEADGGTLFLDEIGEMSPRVQAKLLRVLQERVFRRLGGTSPVRVDVRLITATNRDLQEAMARGEFRDDLFYRLNVFEIHVPPLRERPEDILVLAERFLEELGRRMGRPAAGMSRDAREWMLDYRWPGNVRELRNAIERAILLCDGGLITRQHLPAAARTPEASGGAAAGEVGDRDGLDLADAERRLVERALERAGGNKTRAARLLGLSRSQLYTRLERYDLR